MVRADLCRSEMDLTEADRGPPIGGGLTDKQAGDLHAVFANKECCISFPAKLNQLDVYEPRALLCAFGREVAEGAFWEPEGLRIETLFGPNSSSPVNRAPNHRPNHVSVAAGA